VPGLGVERLQDDIEAAIGAAPQADFELAAIGAQIASSVQPPEIRIGAQPRRRAAEAVAHRHLGEPFGVVQRIGLGVPILVVERRPAAPRCMETR
jgi:hypothetical protein